MYAVSLPQTVSADQTVIQKAYAVTEVHVSLQIRAPLREVQRLSEIAAGSSRYAVIFPDFIIYLFLF
jgi:hypothetical protein